MMRNVVIAAVVPSAIAFSVFNQNGNGNFLGLGSDMRPDMVANTLVKVEDGWMKQATQFAKCMAEGDDCESSSEAFSKSCSQVINGIVQGSAGDRERTAEYMADVCGQKALTGWHQATCLSLRKSLAEKMTDSQFDNRESMKTGKVCTEAWNVLVDEQKQLVAKEIADRKEAEAKAKEEEEKEAKEEQEAKEQAEKKESEAAIMKAREAEEEAEEKEKEMKDEDEVRKKKEKQEEQVEETDFEKTKKEVEKVEAEADEKIEEADEIEHDDVKPVPVAKAAPTVAMKAAAPKETKPTVAKETVVAKPVVPTKETKAEPVMPAKEAKAAPAPKETTPAVKEAKSVAKKSEKLVVEKPVVKTPKA